MSRCHEYVRTRKPLVRVTFGAEPGSPGARDLVLYVPLKNGGEPDDNGTCEFHEKDTIVYGGTVD